MDYLIVKFLHVGAMFVATALAVGPMAILVLILRTGEEATILRAFGFAGSLSRAGGISYGLGVVFGITTALIGGIALTSGWLLTAYAVLLLLIVNNLYADRWMKQVHVAASNSDGDRLQRWRRSATPLWSLGGAIVLTLALVFVMVVKPTLF
jgi:hypothetical protein